MNQDIHTHLEKLKTELSKLEPAIKHLQKADKNVTDLVDSLNSVHGIYSSSIKSIVNANESHLQKIKYELTDYLKQLDKQVKQFEKDSDKLVEKTQTTLKESNNSLQKKIIDEIHNSTHSLNDLEKNISTSFKSVENQIRTLLEEYKSLSAETKKIVEKIDKVDFPIRLDKLDSTVSSINQGLQNTQTRIGDLERNIKDDLLSKQKELAAKIESTETATKQRIDNSEKEFTKMFEKVSKENKLLKILLFVSISLTVGLIIYRIISGQ